MTLWPPNTYVIFGIVTFIVASIAVRGWCPESEVRHTSQHARSWGIAFRPSARIRRGSVARCADDIGVEEGADDTDAGRPGSGAVWRSETATLLNACRSDVHLPFVVRTPPA